MNPSLLLPIITAILAGLLIGFVQPLRRHRYAAYLPLAILLLNSLMICLCLIHPHPSGDLTLFQLSEGLSIAFRIDDLSRLFLALIALIFPLVGLYSYRYMQHEGHIERFWMFYLLTEGMLLAIGMAANLMTLYLFFEAMTLLTMPLVMHAMSEESIAAAFKYLFYSIAGAALALLALVYLHAQGIPLDFLAGGRPELIGSAATAFPLLPISLLAIIGFAAKCGSFPLHAWLPTAHPIAPSPASAILSGLITKAGAMAVIRFVFYLIGPELLRGTWLQYIWMSLALISIFMGSMMAYREPQLKRRLAFSSIGQLGYLMFGLATLHPLSVLGALLHMIVHGLAKNALFLSAGAMIHSSGQILAAKLRGFGQRMPGLFMCFALLSLVMIGIPPSGGFLSKWYIATGSLAADIGPFRWLGPLILLLSALLSAGYLLPIPLQGFFPGEGFVTPSLENAPPGPYMLLPIAILCGLAILLGAFPLSLIGFLEGIVGSIFGGVLI